MVESGMFSFGDFMSPEGAPGLPKTPEMAPTAEDVSDQVGDITLVDGDEFIRDIGPIMTESEAIDG